jgi:hypothetical protein
MINVEEEISFDSLIGKRVNCIVFFSGGEVAIRGILNISDNYNQKGWFKLVHDRNNLVVFNEDCAEIKVSDYDNKTYIVITMGNK